MSDKDYLGMSDAEHFDSLMMRADIANKEARGEFLLQVAQELSCAEERFTCAVCNSDVPNPDVDWCNVCRPGKRKPAQEPTETKEK